MSKLFLVLIGVVLLSACSDENQTSITATPTAGSRVTATVATASATSTPGPAVTDTPVANSTPGAQATGVAGVALVGPACPVVRLDTPCPDKPWEGTVAVQTPLGAEVARVETDAAGRFRFDLAPGDYVVVSLTNGVFPSPASAEVTVVAGQVAEIQLLLDSGIR
jgi:hypothetical protein